MSTAPTPGDRGRGRGRGGLGKYLRARGRRGGGRPAEFGKRLRLEDEESDVEDDEGDEEHGNDKYAKRQIVTNVDKYEEPEVDPHVEVEPEPEVDLSSFLERQRLNDKDGSASNQEEEFDDGIDHSLSYLPSSSSSTPNTRKNKIQTVQWDASMDQLKREKEAAEAVWDLKSRFRKNQPRLVASNLKPSLQRDSRSEMSKAEDSRHVYKPPDAGTDLHDPEEKSTSKIEMEDFLDDLLS